MKTLSCKYLNIHNVWQLWLIVNQYLKDFEILQRAGGRLLPPMECPILIGKAYCGHCGARLVATTNGKKYVRKDGEVAKKYRTRYVCYNKTRHKHKCDGQTGYTVSKLDKMIDEVVHRLFAGLSDLPKETIIRKRYKKGISEKQTAFAQ